MSDDHQTSKTMTFGRVTATKIAGALVRSAEELESSFYDPKKRRVSPRSIEREIKNLRSWAKLLHSEVGHD